MAMNNSISSDLQSRLLSLSSLVHDDKSAPEAKSLKMEEIGSIILKKIYAENSNLPTSSRQYLEEIASSIIDKKWSSIPKPDKLNLDFKLLKDARDALALAYLSTTIDLFELFRFMMKYKGDEAYNLAKISMKDTETSLQLEASRFSRQESANQWELGAGIAANASQIIMGGVQFGSSLHSISKNLKLGSKTRNNISDELTVSRDRRNLENFTKDRDDFKGRYNSLEAQINAKKNEINPNSVEISRLRYDQRKIKTELDKADKLLKSETSHVDFLSSSQKKLTSDIETQTNAARYKDQLRNGVIQGSKGILDMVGSGLKFVASTEKLAADRLESTKNMSDRSATAMIESSKKSAEDVKKLQQFLESILQMMDASIKKQFS
jgi:hypothetical protein